MYICLWPEFDCPEVTLCSWQDIKIQLQANKQNTQQQMVNQHDQVWDEKTWGDMGEGGGDEVDINSKTNAWVTIFTDFWSFSSLTLLFVLLCVCVCLLGTADTEAGSVRQYSWQ